MISWCVVHAQPLKEQMAKQHLLEQGFEVFLPMFLKTRRHARKVEEVLAPLFPRYLFVGIDREVTQFRSINSTRGVSYLLMNKDQPAVVPSSVICELQAQQESDGAVPVASLCTFVEGDRVRVTEGMFKDQAATFVGLTGQQRVQILLQFLGRAMSIDLPIHAVEAN